MYRDLLKKYIALTYLDRKVEFTAPEMQSIRDIRRELEVETPEDEDCYDN